MGKLKAGEKSVGCALLENLLRTLRKSHFRPAPAICLSEINPPSFWSGLLKKRRKTVRERERGLNVSSVKDAEKRSFLKSLRKKRKEGGSNKSEFARTRRGLEGCVKTLLLHRMDLTGRTNDSSLPFESFTKREKGRSPNLVGEEKRGFSLSLSVFSFFYDRKKYFFATQNLSRFRRPWNVLGNKEREICIRVIMWRVKWLQCLALKMPDIDYGQTCRI